MKEEPVPARRTYIRSDTTTLSTVEVALKLGHTHQVRHSNSAQNPTENKLDTATLALTSGEDPGVPSHSYCLFAECANLLISGLRRIEVLKERDKKVNGISEVFGFISHSHVWTCISLSPCF